MDKTDQWKVAVEAHRYLFRIAVGFGKNEKGELPALDIDLLGIQGALRQFFEQFLLPVISGEEKRSPNLTRPQPQEDHFFYAHEGNLNLAFVGSSDYKTEAVDSFLRAITSAAPIPLDAFRKCEGCDNYFFPAGKGVRKQRRFCTSACNMRYNARKRREKDPEGYRKKQRKIMRKKYREQKKKELGPNVKIGQTKKRR